VNQIDLDQSLNHGGRFEWVDSMLVQCLRDGDWLLIENVNFCRFVEHLTSKKTSPMCSLGSSSVILDVIL